MLITIPDGHVCVVGDFLTSNSIKSGHLRLILDVTYRGLTLLSLSSYFDASILALIFYVHSCTQGVSTKINGRMTNCVEKVITSCPIWIYTAFNFSQCFGLQGWTLRTHTVLYRTHNVLLRGLTLRTYCGIARVNS